MRALIFCFPIALRVGVICFLELAGPVVSGASAATLTSSDGKSRDFPVVVSAARSGLTVRESETGKDIVIPWARLNVPKSLESNPWLGAAKEKALAGETVVLNLGLSKPAAPDPSAGPPSDPVLSGTDQPEWRRSPTEVAIVGGKGNFDSLTLSGYAHREVSVPRLAVVWVGGVSPLAKRSDAADLARRMQGALVVAHFEGNYLDAAGGSGEALVSGVASVLKSLRLDGGPVGEKEAGKRGGKPTAGKTDGGKGSGGAGGEGMADSEKSDEQAELAVRSRPALVVMGEGESASFVWSLVCARPADVMAAVMVNGVHTAESTAGAFATPCLFLESPPPDPASGGADNLKRPQALWRHYSTDGSRWCYAAPTGDALALAVAFVRDVAGASPYVDALDMLESWEHNSLRHRIPMPVATVKSFKENGFRLATPDGASVFPVKSKTGAARNDLVWVPSAAFAARLRSP